MSKFIKEILNIVRCIFGWLKVCVDFHLAQQSLCHNVVPYVSQKAIVVVI